MWCLLVALALVPTIGMGVFAAGTAMANARRAEHSARVAGAMRELSHLLDVSYAMTDEQVPTQGVLRAGSFGVSVEQASAMLGFDIDDRLVTTRRTLDAALDAVPEALFAEHDELARIRRELPGLRREADGAGAEADRLHARYQALSSRVWDLAQREMRQLRDVRHGLVDQRMVGSVDTFSALTAVFHAAHAETGAMAVPLFGGDVPFEVQLATAHADFDRAAIELAASPDPGVREGWARISARPEVARLDAATDAMLVDAGWLTAAGNGRIAEVFSDIFVRIDLLAGLTRDAVHDAVGAALDAEESARNAYVRSVATSGALGVLAVGAAVVVSRSISAPLGALARRAGRMTEGELEASVTAAGPTEVRTVARALAEAADSLRRIEEQAQALAAGRLDDPVLSAAVPGVLGESVHASVAQLSQSLRDQDELRRRLDAQAHHDALTGLANRAGLLVAAEQALARAHRTGEQVALLFLDLDGFKRANDSHGHRFGDDVLRAMAERLVEAARAGDTVARLGGDEFVVVAESPLGIGQAVALGERLIAAVTEPLVIDGRTAGMGASVGISVCQDGRETAIELLAEADQAVFRAKRAGGGRVEVFDEVLRHEVAARNEIEAALRTAIPGGELLLHYQPVVATDTGRLQGFEALVRWERPGHGLVPPMAFIPVAEACELVLDLGRWVLDEATSQLAAWSAHLEMADAHVAVNISGRHLLNACVVGDVAAALDRSGLAPERLVIEITETVILSDLGVAVAHLEDLRRLGVRIALDDFGTGYTSIGQLGRLPVDVLKIDRAFVDDLHLRADRSIVELMVGVAHTLGLGLVAEGVETDDQLAALRELDCDHIQGFYLARPLPADAARAWATSPDRLGPQLAPRA